MKLKKKKVNKKKAQKNKTPASLGKATKPRKLAYTNKIT
jgi:hypothetical protein